MMVRNSIYGGAYAGPQAGAQDAQGLGMVPMVIEQSGRGERSYDIYCACSRSVSFSWSARSMTRPPTWWWRSCCSWKVKILTRTFPSTSTPRGSVTAGMAIYDTMQFIKPDVSTLCVGMAASMGAFLLSAGAKGKRFSLPNSRVMIHQPSGGAQGQATDIEIHARDILKTRDQLNRILAANTGQPIEKIERDTERDYFLFAEDAKEYGLVDQVISRRP